MKKILMICGALSLTACVGFVPVSGGYVEPCCAPVVVVAPVSMGGPAFSTAILPMQSQGYYGGGNYNRGGGYWGSYRGYHRY